MLKWFPLILLSVIFYNLLIFAGPAIVGGTAEEFLSRGVALTMFSGDVWHFSLGDMLVLATLVLLFIEVAKATGTTSVEVLNHGLSMATFIVALVEFLIVPRFSTTPFFFITVIALFDVVAGFVISIVAAKRDLGATGGLIGTH